MVWINIKIDDLETIQKALNLLTTVNCTANLKVVKQDYLEYILRKITKDPHIFLYEDNIFQILLIFLDVLPEKEEIELVKCAIKWDFNNESINPLDVLNIMAKKTREFMIQKGNKKIWMEPYKYNDIPFAHILEWYNDTIISVYLNHKIKVTKIEKEELLRWEFEVIK